MNMARFARSCERLMLAPFDQKVGAALPLA
jgi:hypothetical protein